MTRDEIIQMALEAGIFTTDLHCATASIDIVERFAALAAAAELRRLQAENEANERNLCQLTDELAKTVTLLRKALELLEDNREDVARVETTYMHTHYDPVVHAIKCHLGEPT